MIYMVIFVRCIDIDCCSVMNIMVPLITLVSGWSLQTVPESALLIFEKCHAFNYSRTRLN